MVCRKAAALSTTKQNGRPDESERPLGIFL
jgi:hypothetical protein